MKGGTKKPHGFTIIEVLIVLAVTSGLLFASGLLVSGREAQTQFDQGIREIQAQIQQTTSDVINGFYPNNNRINCSIASVGPPIITSVLPNQLGTNSGCLFIGKAVNFLNPGASSNPSQYAVYTIAGRQCAVGATPGNSCSIPSSLSAFVPAAIAPTTGVPYSSYPDASVYQPLASGITIVKLTTTTGGVTSNAGSIAFLSSPTNAQQVGVYPVTLSSFGTDGSPNGYKNGPELLKIDTNLIASGPADSAMICFKSGTTNQWGIINIVQGAGQLETTLTIQDSTC